MTYKFGTQKKQNTSFQKRERGFYVFGNSYFGSPIRNGLTPENKVTIRKGQTFFNFQKNIIESTFQGFISLSSVCRSRQKMKNTIEDKSHDIPEICVDKILLVPPVTQQISRTFFIFRITY